MSQNRRNRRKKEREGNINKVTKKERIYAALSILILFLVAFVLIILEALS